ncbi:hypothetical protein L1987_80849 [Smallanthus sonchifolius]|uniref:Uncharacterized protein n=1 Tax=Smallanthus sonchifolius TaxID=185202 RepID=A0ACB8YPE0_9ASTR|nr:hypothetical protein L1987_80849 [Smallanthus sonchifolius]
MDNEDLELQNKNSNTALSLAAVIEIPGNNRMMPLYMAALFAKPEMVRSSFLKSPFTRENTIASGLI